MSAQSQMKNWAEAIRGDLFRFLPTVLVFAVFYAILTAIGMRDVHQAVRLSRLGTITPVTVRLPYFAKEEGWKAGVLMPVSAEHPDRTVMLFTADRAYSEGEPAYLLYAESLTSGVVVSTPSPSLWNVVFVTNSGVVLVSIAVIAALVFTNLGLILTAALNHTFGSQIATELRGARSWSDRAFIRIRAALEAVLAAGSSLVIVAALIASFTIALRMDSENPWPMRLVYIALVAFLASHVVGGFAVGLLTLLRSRIGKGIREAVALVILCGALVGFLVKLARFVISDRIYDLSSWWDVAKAFAQALFS